MLPAVFRLFIVTALAVRVRRNMAKCYNSNTETTQVKFRWVISDPRFVLCQKQIVMKIVLKLGIFRDGLVGFLPQGDATISSNYQVGK